MYIYFFKNGAIKFGLHPYLDSLPYRAPWLSSVDNVELSTCICSCSGGISNKETAISMAAFQSADSAKESIKLSLHLN